VTSNEASAAQTPGPRVSTLDAGRRIDPRRSQLRRSVHRFLTANRLNLLGLIIVILFFVLAIFGEWLAPHDPFKQDITNSALLAPSWSHPMGTDELGRDVLSRVMTGTRYSLQVAAVVLGFSVVFGTVVGAVAGYFGGIIDEILMRFTDLFLAFPALVLATVFWPWYARLVRGQVLAVRARDFVEAGRSVGLSDARLMFRHILPNCISVVIIQMTLDVGYAVLTTSSLSFIGLGAQPPDPEWGTMMSTARNYFRESWWYITFPGVALTLTVFAFNVLGDGLQDALDPRSSKR
jgi:peptide/nickel transport system permease protein